MWYAILGVSIAVVGALAFYAGRKLAGKPEVQSKTTTFLIKSIQAIAELAILEYRTEGVTEMKQKKESILFARWKRGLPRYTAKLKVGFAPAPVKGKRLKVKRELSDPSSSG